MRELFIGVSGINAIDNPGPGVGVARSLKEDKRLHARVVGLAYDAMDPGLYMDWVIDKSFILPYPSGSGDSYFDRLRYIKASYGLDLVIPCLDAELPLYIKHAATLAKEGIRTFLPSMDQFLLRGKDRLPELAKRMTIALPTTRVVNSVDGLLGAVSEIGLPVMVKGVFYKAHRAATTQEALGHFNHLVAEWGYPVIVQQVVSGDELNVIGLGDGEGGTLGLVAIKKISITAQGKIWTGVTIKHRAMLAAAQRFIRAYRWRGPFELECIVSGDTVYLVEINPRLPAWSYFATGIGVNLAAMLARCCLGRPVKPKLEYDAGRLFVRYTYELVTDMERFQKAVTRGEVP